MKTIKVICVNCTRDFEFQHPSVSGVEDLRHVTLDCRYCGETLKMPEDEVYMISMNEFIRRDLVAQGLVGPDDPITTGYIDLDDNVLEVDFQQRAKVTPAVMPPHPPERKRSRVLSETPRRPLTHRPFKGLDEVFDQEKD